ncbi:MULTISPECIES: phage tail tube protein [Pasteurellaceae]|uniref:phage tail tube protein n=1 Tax=Pasteurellaceae TaxID=712 RepID=UPI001242E767|nr:MULTISPECIES: phage tail tube protein [Pasteurellaceae]MCW9698202.1 phage tail tube protein [Avibacterium sp. 20-129]
MATKFQGTATIRFNGKEYPTDNDGSLDVGGKERETVKGSQVYGFSEKPKEATVDVTVFNCEETDVMELKNMTNATVEFETDVGQTYLLPNAWAVETGTLSADGKIKVKMAAIECKRV